MITQSDLDSMARDLEELLVDKCQISSPGRTDDDYGGHSQAFTDVGTPVRCDVTEASKDEGESAQQDRATSVADFVIFLPVGTVIDTDDRVTLVERMGEAVADGPVYEVVGSTAGGESLAVGVQVTAIKVK